MALGSTHLDLDVCLLGGGSGGISAAAAAARNGADVVLLEKQSRLGGTSTQAYVCNWEPGPGNGLCRELYGRMQRQNAVCLVRDHNPDRKLGPFGLWLPDPEATYEQTLTRAATPSPDWRACVFEPEAFHGAASSLLAETGRCRVLLNCEFLEASGEGQHVVSVRARDSDGVEHLIRAKVYLDCTGGAHLCRALGGEVMIGREGRDRFGELSAPEAPDQVLNGISLCYRIRRSKSPLRQQPAASPPQGWAKSAHVSGLPNGDRIVNPLAILPGVELLNLGYDQALEECRWRADAHWHWLQGYPSFAEFEFDSFAPMLGIRESYRAVGEYVLTQRDLLEGVSRQEHPDLIALADHAMDVHGEGGVCQELAAPYGVPFRCLVPKGWQNLLVACRGASLSHLAASSCRLSRTMMQLGTAAGTAAALASASDTPVAQVDAADLKRRLFPETTHPLHPHG